MIKIPTEWLVVTLVAILGVTCLVASHKMKSELVMNKSASLEAKAH